MYSGGILSKDGLTEEDQLSIEHIVSTEEVPEESNITIRVVERLMNQNIRIPSQPRMHRVVLQVGAVQMRTRIPIDSVLAQYSLEEPHAQKVGVGVAWSHKTNGSAGVLELVVPHHGETWGKVGLAAVGDGAGGGLGQLPEGRGHGVGEFLVVDVTGGRHSDVVSRVELLVEGVDLLGGDVMHVLADASHWLPEVVVLEAPIMEGLHGSGLGAFYAGRLLVDGVLFGFNLLRVEFTVGQQIVKQLHSLLDVLVGEGDGIRGGLSGDFSLDESTQGIQRLLDLLLGFIGGSLSGC